MKWHEAALQRSRTIGRATWSKARWAWQKIQPGQRKAKPHQKHRHTSWVDNLIDNAFMVITGLAFLAFLVASLPHVAYFFATFEPQDAPGIVSEWWWIVAYLIAGVINMTEFLLAIKFARKLHQATYGLPWYQKFLPVIFCVIRFWPFIVLIAGFSWVANLQHAREFHSFMLATAESEGVSIPFMPYIKTWGDLNPYIVSAFPILNVAYTLMFDSSRHGTDETYNDVSVSETNLQLTNVSESAPVTLTDLQNLQLSNLQMMKEMQAETVKALTTALQQFATYNPPAQPTQRVKAPPVKVEKKPEIKRSGSQYKEAITGLYRKNRQITATEAGRLVGCSHVTAAGILKELRGVKVTEVKLTTDERDTDEVKVVSESESA